MNTAAPIRFAATVVLLRPRAGAPLAATDVYLLRRLGSASFWGGAHVFPGGKVDATDAEIAHRSLQEHKFQEIPTWFSDEVLPFLGAALRETDEECGVKLSARSLHPWSSWLTPEQEPRRYDTRFFVAIMPEDQEAQVNLDESTEGIWLSPQQALSMCDAGQMVLAPPTFATLEDIHALLVQSQTLDELHQYLSSHGSFIHTICPVIYGFDEGETCFSLPGDHLHPVSSVVPMPTLRTRIIRTTSGLMRSHHHPK